MEADLERFYHRDLLDLWRGILTPRKCAVLTAYLPDGAQVWVAAGHPAAWDRATYLLHASEFSLRVLRWMKTEDGSKNRNKPEPFPTPPEAAEEREQRSAKEDRLDREIRAFRERQRRREEGNDGS